MTDTEKLDAILSQMGKVEVQMGKVEGELSGIGHRLGAIEGRLVHLQTIGTWLFAGVLGSYAAILAVALKV